MEQTVLDAFIFASGGSDCRYWGERAKEPVLPVKLAPYMTNGEYEQLCQTMRVAGTKGVRVWLAIPLFLSLFGTILFFVIFLAVSGPGWSWTPIMIVGVCFSGVCLVSLFVLWCWWVSRTAAAGKVAFREAKDEINAIFLVPKGLQVRLLMRYFVALRNLL
jgi:hypothetical protein